MKVSDIKKLNFSALPLEMQLEIKNTARPTPALDLIQMDKGSKSRGQYTRHFDKKVYEKAPWICGCEENNSLFCFVCLLFGGSDSWTESGVNDLKHLNFKMRKHETSKKHKHNYVSFQLLGRSNICASFTVACAETIHKHNEKVKKMRGILSKVIDILKFCGGCNLPLREEGSNSKGLFLALVNYTRRQDAAFNSHMELVEETQAFEATSKAIQDELLQCMLDVCRENIAKEIKQSAFLTLMAEDTTNLSAQTQTALIFRYELNGRIHERFWGFSKPEKQDAKDAKGLSTWILEQIDPILESSKKLICQTYDGAAIKGDVNIKVKEQYKNAHYVYCYAHQLGKLLEQAVSDITSVKLFFANLNGIAAFFSHSPDRIAALEYVCNEKGPRPSQIRWNFKSKIVQTVSTYKYDILDCFDSILVGIPKNYNSETIRLAAGFINWLENNTFLFWLDFYAKIMPHVDTLSKQLQVLQTDIPKIVSAVYNFEQAIIGIMNSLPNVVYIKDEVRVHADAEEPRPRKRRRLNVEDLNSLAKEVCDTIIFQVKDRFVFRNHLCGARLFQPERFERYKEKLPTDMVEFCAAFPMIDKTSFVTDLDVFYSRLEFTENMAGCLKTLNFLTSSGLDGTFKEITKALKILVTIPMITSEAGRCFSTLKAIESYLRNAVDEDKRLNALCMLSVEQSMIREMSDFNDLVIEKFTADQNRGGDFSYKSMN